MSRKRIVQVLLASLAAAHNSVGQQMVVQTKTVVTYSTLFTTRTYTEQIRTITTILKEIAPQQISRVETQTIIDVVRTETSGWWTVISTVPITVTRPVETSLQTHVSSSPAEETGSTTQPSTSSPSTGSSSSRSTGTSRLPATTPPASRTSNTSTANPTNTNSPAKAGTSNNQQLTLSIGASVGGAIFICCIAFGIWYWIHRRRRQRRRYSPPMITHNVPNPVSQVTSATRYKSIQRESATDAAELPVQSHSESFCTELPAMSPGVSEQGISWADGIRIPPKRPKRQESLNTVPATITDSIVPYLDESGKYSGDFRVFQAKAQKETAEDGITEERLEQIELEREQRILDRQTLDQEAVPAPLNFDKRTGKRVVIREYHWPSSSESSRGRGPPPPRMGPAHSHSDPAPQYRSDSRMMSPDLDQKRRPESKSTSWDVGARYRTDSRLTYSEERGTYRPSSSVVSPVTASTFRPTSTVTSTKKPKGYYEFDSQEDVSEPYRHVEMPYHPEEMPYQPEESTRNTSQSHARPRLQIPERKSRVTSGPPSTFAGDDKKYRPNSESVFQDHRTQNTSPQTGRFGSDYAAGNASLNRSNSQLTVSTSRSEEQPRRAAREGRTLHNHPGGARPASMSEWSDGTADFSTLR